jgi:hypothetical protein
MLWNGHGSFLPSLRIFGGFIASIYIRQMAAFAFINLVNMLAVSEAEG